MEVVGLNILGFATNAFKPIYAGIILVQYLELLKICTISLCLTINRKVSE